MHSHYSYTLSLILILILTYTVSSAPPPRGRVGHALSPMPFQLSPAWQNWLEAERAMEEQLSRQGGFNQMQQGMDVKQMLAREMNHYKDQVQDEFGDEVPPHVSDDVHVSDETLRAVPSHATSVDAMQTFDCLGSQPLSCATHDGVRVVLDISINRVPVGSVAMMLFEQSVPHTVANFKEICERGVKGLKFDGNACQCTRKTEVHALHMCICM